MNFDVSVIIVAGGNGSRMKSEIPKQFLRIAGKPIFVYSIEAIIKAFPQAQLILVLPAAHISFAQALADEFIPHIQLTYCEGGESRFHSTANGLQYANRKITMIHDAVRPFINTPLLRTLYNDCLIFQNAVPAVAVIDSVRLVEINDKSKALNRTQLRSIQTPQAFLTTPLKLAYSSGFQEFFTDDASVLENAGGEIHLVEGLIQNIKITNPQDLYLAQYILQQGID